MGPYFCQKNGPTINGVLLLGKLKKGVLIPQGKIPLSLAQLKSTGHCLDRNWGRNIFIMILYNNIIEAFSSQWGFGVLGLLIL